MTVKKNGGAMTFNLTHARHDPAHCLAPGLFRSLKRGERKKQKLDISYIYGDESLRFVGFEPLDDFDMRLLQGLIAASGPSKLIIHLDDPKDGSPKQLSLFLNPEFDAADQDSKVVKTSIYGLMREIGLTNNGRTIADIKSSLLRLSNVTVQITSGKRYWSCNLMSHAVDENDGRLMVALNPRISGAILGDRPYTRISMAEVRIIKISATRLIHQRLCAYIASGKTHPTPIEIDTLCGYVWPDEASAVTMRQRRVTARKAISELIDIGWTFEEVAKNKYKICRADVL